MGRLADVYYRPGSFVAHALAMNLRTLSASLRPGADSTPETTSIPQGCSVVMAWETFSGSETSGQNKVRARLRILKETNCRIPIEGDPGSSNGSFCSGIHQKRINILVRSEASSFYNRAG